MHPSFVGPTPAALEAIMSALRKALLEYDHCTPPPVSEDDLTESE